MIRSSTLAIPGPGGGGPGSNYIDIRLGVKFLHYWDAGIGKLGIVCSRVSLRATSIRIFLVPKSKERSFQICLPINRQKKVSLLVNIYKYNIQKTYEIKIAVHGIK